MTQNCKIPVGLAAALVDLGVSPAAVLAAARLPSQLFDRHQLRLSVAEYFALWQAIRHVSGDPNVGLELGRSVRTDHTEPLFLAVMSAASAAAAVQIVSTYKRLLSPEDVLIRRDDARGELVVIFRRPVGQSPPQALLDSELSFVVDMCRRGTGTTLSPREVQLRAPALEAGSRHRDYFGGTLRFAAPDNALVFGLEDMERPFVTSNPQMLNALVPYLKSTTPNRSESFANLVRSVVSERLRGRRPTLALVARELAVSARSMQRLLSADGTSFREVLDDVRNEHARGYLRSTAFSDGEVSFLLGFEDANSFYRAFRSWNGVSPSVYRARESARS